MSDFTEENKTCPTVAYQLSSVCVPVTVTPFAKAGTTVTKCCTKPTVIAGEYACNGVKNGQCVFTISQDICVEVPIEFGAVAAVGDTYVACDGASADDICPDCATEHAEASDENVETIAEADETAVDATDAEAAAETAVDATAAVEAAAETATESVAAAAGGITANLG